MPKIIDSLKDFAKQLIDLIADNREEGQKRLLSVFEKASAEYDEPKNSYLWSWIYGYSRQRSEEFKQALSELQTFPDPIIRLQDFQKFVNKGKWKKTSGNTKLFLFLIREIKGYDAETDEYLHGIIIPRLAELIREQIEHRLEVATREEARKKELEEMHMVTHKELDAAMLYADKVNVGQTLQKRHGIALITTNNWKKIPPYKLISGTYFLTREPDAKTGSWVLYQRQKGGVNQEIETDDWEEFHKILAGNDDFSAEELSISVKENLRDCVKNADKIVHKKQTLCTAVKDFSLVYLKS